MLMFERRDKISEALNLLSVLSGDRTQWLRFHQSVSENGLLIV